MGQQTRGGRYSGKADTSDTGERQSDARERRQKSRGRDAPLERAYKAGYEGGDREEAVVLGAAESDYSADELDRYYADGQAAKAAESKAASRSARGDALKGQVAAGGAKAGSVANDGAGFLLGLFAYALLANYLRYGVPGVKGWLSAKFINSTGRSAAQLAQAGKEADKARRQAAGR